MAGKPIWYRSKVVFEMTPDFLRELNSTRDRYWDAQLQLLGVAPSGWLYRNAVALDRFSAETIAHAVNSKNHTVQPKLMQKAVAIQMASSNKPWDMLIRAFAVGNVPLAQRVAQYQTAVDEAVVACALERYYLNRGEYPLTLDSLVPAFISTVPHDVIDGNPLRYRRTDDGGYVLYSIGWNETDDGGTVAMTSWKPRYWNPNQGDWVWIYPPSALK
jgi:hypothetical protein